MLIKLIGGQHCTIDYIDWHLVSDNNWYVMSTRNAAYAYSTQGVSIAMHRKILGLRPGDPLLVDHKDGNGLNNTRANLRITTYSLNNFNSPPRNEYKGIYLTRGKWRARIYINGTNTSLGTYDDPIEAAKAYDKAAYAYAGEFAYLNFPLEVEIAGTLDPA